MSESSAGSRRKYIAPTVLAVVLFIIAAVVWIVNGAERPNHRCTGDEATYYEGSSSPCIGIASETPEERTSRYAGDAAIYAGLLFIATGILAFFTFTLWSATGRLVRDSEITAKQELRAYLGFSHRWIHGKRYKDSGRLETERLAIKTETDGRENYTAGIYVANYGRTPAEVYFKGTCKILRHPATRPAINGALNDATVGRYVEAAKLANPSIELPLYYEMRSSVAALKPAENERIYSIGTAIYRDIFERWHFSNVCVSHNPASTTGSTWETAKEFNDAGSLTEAERLLRFAELWPGEAGLASAPWRTRSEGFGIPLYR